MKRPQSITTDARAEASSTLKNDTLHYGANYAVDSDVTTSWISADSVGSITVTLDREASFSKFFIIESENSIRKFSVEAIKEGKEIQVYQSEVLPLTNSNSFMGYGIIEFTLPEVLTTRQFRIQIQQSDGHPSIYSIRLK